MSFLFVDHISKLEPGKESVGVKEVTHDDVFFHSDNNGKKALFPCIIGEALGQLCSWNVLKTSDFKYRPVGGVVQEIEMFDFAYLGDSVLLESNIETLDHDNALVSFSGQASVNGKILIKVKNSLAPLLPLQEFNNIDQVKTTFEKLSQPNYKKNSESIIAQATQIYPIQYDEIISFIPEKEVIAEKTVSKTAPYFATHFPNKPVFPLSLLMEYNLKLSREFMANENWHAIALRKIKIGNFIFPGDTVRTKITLKQQNEHHALLALHNEVNNKKVCVAEVEFGARS